MTDPDHDEWLAAFAAWAFPPHGKKSDPLMLSKLLRSERAVPKVVTQALGALIDPTKGSEVYDKHIVLVSRPADVRKFYMAIALQSKLTPPISQMMAYSELRFIDIKLESKLISELEADRLKAPILEKLAFKPPSKENAARKVGKEFGCTERTVMAAWSQAAMDWPDLFAKLPRLERRRAKPARTKSSLKKI